MPKAFKRRSSARRIRSRKTALRTPLAPDAAASTATRPNVRDDGQRPSWRDGMAGFVVLIWGGREPEYFCERDWTGQITLMLLVKLAPARTSILSVPVVLASSIVYFHPQSANVRLIATEKLIAVTGGNRAGARIDQIIAPDPRAITLRQPFRDFDEAAVDNKVDALVAPRGRLLSAETQRTRESLEDQLRVRLTNHCLTFRRHEVVDLLDLVFDVPELTGNAHASTFMEPIVLIGGSLIGKLPEISAGAHEYRRAEQFAGAKIAHAATATV